MAYLRMNDERRVRAIASEFTVTLPSKPKNPVTLTGFFVGVSPRGLVIKISYSHLSDNYYIPIVAGSRKVERC